ncbi:MAG: hypothetical protein OEM52_07425 [bacterium]|nr:hypothetical protein [bacterium]
MTIPFSAQQAQQIRSDMKSLIECSGETANRTRQQIGMVEYGGAHVEESVDQITFPVLRKPLPESDLTKCGNGVLLSVLPEVDLQEIDLVTVDGVHYGIAEITEFNLFGVLTHKEIKLEPYRSRS